MTRINTQRRVKVFQYRFEIVTIEGKRKYINKLGFRTKKEGLKAF